MAKPRVSNCLMLVALVSDRVLDLPALSSPIASSPAADAAPRQALLTALAQGLKLLADHALPHANAAVEVAELAARAEELAAEAWKRSSVRTPDPAGARALAESFQAFIAEAAELSWRAARSAAATREAGAIMVSHASELTKLATSSVPPDIATLRATLRPIVASLEQLPAHLAENRAMADDVASLGVKATELGAQAMTPQAYSRPANAAALAIYRNLRILGDEAAALASTMRSDAERLRSAIGSIAGHADRLATAGQAPACTVTAETRIGNVVAQGRAIEWGSGTPRRV